MSPRTRIRDEQVEDLSFISEAELNQFFSTVVVTGTEDTTEVTQRFDDYFPGRGLITAGVGVTVATGSNFVQISAAGATTLPLVGDTFISVVTGTNSIQLSTDAIVGGANVLVTSGTDRVTIAATVPNVPAIVSGNSATLTVTSGTSTITLLAPVDKAIVSDGGFLTIASGTNTVFLSTAAIIAGANTTVTSGSNTVTIAAIVPNVPALVAPTVGANQLIQVTSGTNTLSIGAKSIIAGAGITVTSGTSTVTINSTISSPNAIVGISGNTTVISGSSTTTVSGVVTVTSGIAYINDPTRNDKSLSVTRPLLSFGQNGLADGNYLSIHGSDDTAGGYPIFRPATITSISAFFPSGPANKQFELRKNGVASSIKTFLVSAGTMHISDAENLDLNKGDRLQVFVSSALTGAQDPVVNVEIAWRLP